MPAGHHLDRLREAMDHVPSEWRYNGDVRDTGFPGDGRCACGHKIRYEFVIERPRDGAKLVIGSHCIRTSVPYLMEEGAKHLAEALERASAEHEREREREKRDGRARDALGQATDDIRRLADWFEREQARCRAAAAERGQVVEALADDLHQPPRAPEPAETPGRTLARARRRFTTAWLRATRTSTKQSRRSRRSRRACPGCGSTSIARLPQVRRTRGRSSTPPAASHGWWNRTIRRPARRSRYRPRRARVARTSCRAILDACPSPLRSGPENITLGGVKEPQQTGSLKSG